MCRNPVFKCYRLKRRTKTSDSNEEGEELEMLRGQEALLGGLPWMGSHGWAPLTVYRPDTDTVYGPIPIVYRPYTDRYRPCTDRIPTDKTAWKKVTEAFGVTWFFLARDVVPIIVG